MSVNLAELGKDPSLWPDPELFLPERWLGKYKGMEADKKATLPFSAGPRNCIGMQYVPLSYLLMIDHGPKFHTDLL